MTTAIISHGNMEDLDFHRKVIRECDLIICADGGAYHAKRLGIEPHVIIGDFDSCDEDFIRSFKDAEIVRYPRNKAKTDTELAVDYAIAKNQNHILLIGSTGSRLDHTFANIGLLKVMLDRDVKGEIINEKNRIILIKDSVKVKGQGCYFSLLPFCGEVSDITLRGFKYPLSNYTLGVGSSRCISNELQDEAGEIEIKDGLLLVIESRD